MRLTVVGCSGSVPGPESPASAYLLTSGEAHLLLDFGSGALGPLQRHIKPTDLAAVVLTHLHADHCLDLCSYVVYRRHGKVSPGKRERGRDPMPVLGPAGAAARIAAAYGPDAGSSPDLSDVVAFGDLVDGGRWQLGPFSIEAARVRHSVEAYAVRVEADGASVVYSGDTGPCQALADLAHGCDLLLCEASRSAADDDGQADAHLTGREAGTVASKAEVGRLLLTHIPPWTDNLGVLGEACETFRGLVEIAAPSSRYDL